MRSATPGTVLPMNKINSMWVWIPRYKYKIPSDIGKSSNVTDPPQIEVEFESGIATTGSSLSSCSITATNCYYTHPAFRNGNNATLLTEDQKNAEGHTGWDTELTGIWVGKFETGGTTSAPLIKPDITPLTNQTVISLFKTSLVFAGGTMNDDTGDVTFVGNNTYGLSNTVDTHMMKNTEWGAVAYLSQSKYGKNGNKDYTETTDKEIYINNSSSHYTGRSGGTPNKSSTTNGTYSYNGKSCSTINSITNECTGEKDILKGTGVSTTGTIYGIYDMSGAAKYTMGNWAGKTNSYVKTLPSNQKYWDKYTGSSSSSVTSAKAIKGLIAYI